MYLYSVGNGAPVDCGALDAVDPFVGSVCLAERERRRCGKAKTTAAIDASCKLVRERLWRAGKLGARGRGLPRAT